VPSPSKNQNRVSQLEFLVNCFQFENLGFTFRVKQDKNITLGWDRMEKEKCNYATGFQFFAKCFSKTKISIFFIFFDLYLICVIKLSTTSIFASLIGFSPTI